MRVGLISDCVHVQLPDGSVATQNHIYLRQMQALAQKFDVFIICCPFVAYNNNMVLTTYNSAKIRFIPLPNVGGNTLKDKLKLLLTIPLWLSKFIILNKQTDIIYQRFPNNLNIPGFFFFWLIRKKVFATYTGTWANAGKQALTYRFQKWLLRSLFRGPVFVYSNNPKEAKNIYGSFSPSYTLQEWNEETEQVEHRVKYCKKDENILKLITVGALNNNKNQLYIVKSCLLLYKFNIPFQLTIVGVGEMKETLEQFITNNNLANHIKLVGAKTYTELRALYRQHNFVVQAAILEGFGKVPIEGFFHGLIPLLHQSTMAPYLTNNEDRGYLFNAFEEEGLFNLLKKIYNQESEQLLTTKIIKGRNFAKTQTIENWVNQYYTTIQAYFD